MLFGDDDAAGDIATAGAGGMLTRNGNVIVAVFAWKNQWLTSSLIGDFKIEHDECVLVVIEFGVGWCVAFGS